MSYGHFRVDERQPKTFLSIDSQTPLHRTPSINSDQYQFLSMSIERNWSALIGIDRHWSVSTMGSMPEFWSALIGIGHWSGVMTRLDSKVSSYCQWLPLHKLHPPQIPFCLLVNNTPPLGRSHLYSSIHGGCLLYQQLQIVLLPESLNKNRSCRLNYYKSHYLNKGVILNVILNHNMPSYGNNLHDLGPFCLYNCIESLVNRLYTNLQCAWCSCMYLGLTSLIINWQVNEVHNPLGNNV